jgi:UrcA family protein
MNVTQFARHSSTGLAALLVFALGTVSQPVLAGSLIEIPSVTISYADLDVTTPQGTAVLYRRIQSAASNVCGFYHSRDLQRLQAWKHCYQFSVDNAVATVNLPQLTALHQGTAGGSLVARRTARK